MDVHNELCWVGCGHLLGRKMGKLEDKLKVPANSHSFATSEPDAVEESSEDTQDGEGDSLSSPIEDRSVRKLFELREGLYDEPPKFDYSEYEIVDEVQRLFKSYDPLCDPETWEPLPREVALMMKSPKMRCTPEELAMYLADWIENSLLYGYEKPAKQESIGHGKSSEEISF